jgi:hypothetical protein
MAIEMSVKLSFPLLSDIKISTRKVVPITKEAASWRPPLYENVGYGKHYYSVVLLS